MESGIISPSKLRMKLLGARNPKIMKEDESNNNSSRTSPSRQDDSEFANNSLLLPSPDEDLDIQDSSVEVVPEKSDAAASDSAALARQHNDLVKHRTHHGLKGDSSDSSSVHPARACEDENLDYDSTSSFEFHKGERSLHHSINRTFSRPMPSKWNDAEKWIMNRQCGQMNATSKKGGGGYLMNQINRANVPNMVRVAPESTTSDGKTLVKKVDFVQPIGGGATKSGLLHGVSDQQLSLFMETKDLTEVDDEDTKSVTEENRDVPMVRSVSMRDMGTEMTPIPSQDPSRSVTPLTSTPLRSPTSSVPSTPRRGEAVTAPTEFPLSNSTTHNAASEKEEISDKELKLKTRREIVALGVQLGKMNIAAWASKDDKDKNENAAEGDKLELAEYAKRAAAWEEAEQTKHAARFKREEIRIQAWESRQKAKLEAEMKKIEAQLDQMKAQAQAKMVKKVALARHKSEEKRAIAEANKNRLAEKTAAQAEYIRQTGRLPSSQFMCCGWW
ncbi:hypothetical protein M569_15463 [Genlisea aurea]|uniref:Remorin C-terminal domain-containing protein n=1 Tax=Genlisea aurea TaxID=192259 RepID=S8BYA6_9LAMI|nr:hypothetical protein M569_15463 [Genlisea aurea]